ncbi:MAG: hypothetical protein KFF73_15180, partial [Cyclobacteriaceae bacterium]|nr:hypothetical protein [Cyclobacteriaceae bacterium]
MTRISVSIILFVLFISCRQQEQASVIATSSWTAAYVKAAGVNDVFVLAPAEMQHPTEYELDIDDVVKLRHAELIVCGGYEIMMDRIRDGLKIDPERILEIKTDYNLEHIRSSILAVASEMGTEAAAVKNIQEIENVFRNSGERVRQGGIDQEPVLVQFFIQPLAVELDLKVAGLFGPRPLEAFDIRDLMGLEFSMILDNAHNPVSAPLVESGEGIKVVYL